MLQVCFSDMLFISFSIFAVEPPKKKQHRWKVTTKEEEIVLQAYQLFSASGWEDVLAHIKERVSGGMVPGNCLLQNDKIREYYLNASTKAALKRIQWIVNLNVQKPQQPTAETSQSQRMSKSIKESMTRYSSKCCPEERKLNKFAHAANLHELSSSDDSIDEGQGVESVINPDPPSTKKIKKKKTTSRGKLAKQASKSHVDMCDKAMQMMDKISNLLQKYDDSDETDWLHFKTNFALVVIEYLIRT